MNGHHLRGAMGVASIIAVASLAALLGPTGASAQDGHVYKGQTVALGQGTAHAWVMVDKERKPKAVGVSISEAAMRGIEASHGEALTLSFPAEVAGTPFDHVYLNWNPHGHPPAHVWDRPHFDVHFYMVPPAEREAIAETDPAYMRKARHHPAADHIPADYVVEPDPVPAMGIHWADATTPELHGKPFTHTLIYGSWDGRVTFIEPMVAKTVFDGREPVVAPIKQPAAVAVPGRYPTRYRIDFDPAAAEHRIVLEELVGREGTGARHDRHASR